jgi:hypothetical protein
MNMEELPTVSTVPFPQLTPEAIYYLIPGGRFLVSADRELGTVSLWDLGRFNQPCNPLRLVTSTPDLEDASQFIPMAVDVSPAREGGDGLVVAVVGGHAHDDDGYM